MHATGENGSIARLGSCQVRRLSPSFLANLPLCVCVFALSHAPPAVCSGFVSGLERVIAINAAAAVTYFPRTMIVCAIDITAKACSEQVFGASRG